MLHCRLTAGALVSGLVKYVHQVNSPPPVLNRSSYTDRDTAFGHNLVYVTDDDLVIMKGDNTTTLSDGQNRNRYIYPLNTPRNTDRVWCLACVYLVDNNTTLAFLSLILTEPHGDVVCGLLGGHLVVDNGPT